MQMRGLEEVVEELIPLIFDFDEILARRRSQRGLLRRTAIRTSKRTTGESYAAK